MGTGLALLAPNLNPVTGKHVYSHLIFLAICSGLAAILFRVDMDNTFWRSGGFVFTNLLCLSVVVFALRFPNYPLLSNPIARWIGRRSYGIYVYHLPIFLTFEQFIQEHNMLNTLLVNAVRFAITFLVAGLSFRFIEQPILQYGKRAVASYKPA